MTLPAWAREPLVHFLALGAVLYVALTWNADPVDPASRSIAVTAEDQAQLSLAFERLMRRAPTDAELDVRISQFVRDEVLYREALRLGLDQGDAVVRQRMVAKMDMSASAAAEVAKPDDAQLRAYYDENAARYAGDVLVSFEQAYFTAESGAIAALRNPDAAGEAISLPASLEAASLRDVQSQFGEEFTRALAELEPEAAWQGPVRSGFGWHLVRLSERSAQTASFDSVRERVENDWRSAEIASRKEAAFEVLLSAYQVEIDR